MSTKREDIRTELLKFQDKLKQIQLSGDHKDFRKMRREYYRYLLRAPELLVLKMMWEIKSLLNYLEEYKDSPLFGDK